MRQCAQASFEQRRQLVLLLIGRVVVTDADVEIRYVLLTSPDSEHVRFCHSRKDYLLCGLATAYPMNWLLIRTGFKKRM